MTHSRSDPDGPLRRNVVREAEVESHVPANHVETSNRRVVYQETLGAQFLEILVGTLDVGATAAPQPHPGIEQVAHVLDGEGKAHINGEKVTFCSGDWVFFPQGSFREFRVTGSPPLCVIVIYAPPYGERREGAVDRSDAMGHPA